MDKLKLIIACAIVVGLSQLELDGGPQRKYYTGSQAIQARQEAAAAGQPSTSTGGGDQGGGFCSGGICTMRMRTSGSGSSALPEQMAAAENQAPAKTQQQIEQEALQAKIAEQAEALRKMQEQLDAMKTQQAE